MNSQQQPVQIDGAKLFWSVAFQAYRAKAWLDVLDQFPKTFGTLFVFIVLLILWVPAVIIMFPFNVRKKYRRWKAFYEKVRTQKTNEALDKARQKNYTKVSEYINRDRSVENFSLDKFVSQF